MALTTQVAPHVWNKLTDADKKIFTDVTQEAAARATDEIKKREAELVDEFKKKGIRRHDGRTARVLADRCVKASRHGEHGRTTRRTGTASQAIK